jgi:demethylmenaquinone methyltransferase/2-methoxy-6-polyprenyl-1,4-benzoquinol methylase
MPPILAQPDVHPGARPAAESSESAAATHVREIFDAIAPTYDLLNHLMSMGLDRRWWSQTAHAFRDILARPEARVLDLCCGTGDQTAALLALRPRVCSSCGCAGSGLSEPGAKIEPITGLDFSAAMLSRARKKLSGQNVLWVEADAMRLPYPAASFDLVTSAFGFRNLTNYAAALAEIHRVLRPGGQLGILECNQPDGLRGLVYNLYLHRGLPLIGGLISGEPAAYRYLPDSISRFPQPPQMFTLFRNAGFTAPAWEGYLFRAAGLYRATR